jgi:hypothetical protein
VRRPRHQARQGGDHPRHPERRRGGPEGPRRVGHRPHRRRGEAGDILVGKITPKGETQLSPEEKLLRAIFGEKAGDVRDSSLRVPPGVSGIVINAKVFAARAPRRTSAPRTIEDDGEAKLLKDSATRSRSSRTRRSAKMRKLLVGKTTGQARRRQGQGPPPKGDVLDDELLDEVPQRYWNEIPVGDVQDVRKVVEKLEEQGAREELLFGEKIARSRRATSCPRASSRWSRSTSPSSASSPVGDKMAGRHGNKGVVSRILPEEDMPYLEDGTPVDIVLNPLGVPSRMNVGQILETHLGWAAALGEQLQNRCSRRSGRRVLREEAQEGLRRPTRRIELLDELDDEDVRLAASSRKGVHVATPVFDGAQEDRDQGLLDHGAGCRRRAVGALRRPHRRALRPGRHRRRHVHAQAPPPGRRQDPRPLHRALLARHPAAAGRQGAVRRPAPRRDGGLGDGGLRRRLRAAGVPHRQVRRRHRPHPHVRGDRQGRAHARVRACPSRSTCSSRSSSRSASTSSSSRTLGQAPRAEPAGRFGRHGAPRRGRGAPRWARARDLPRKSGGLP